MNRPPFLIIVATLASSCGGSSAAPSAGDSGGEVSNADAGNGPGDLAADAPADAGVDSVSLDIPGEVDCMWKHPIVDGSRRYCEPGRCYCAKPDGCYPADRAAVCCEGPVACDGADGGPEAGSATCKLGGVTKTASDDFERATLGGAWTRRGGSKADIVNGSDLGTPHGEWAFVGRSAETFCADQFSEATIAAGRPATALTQVFVRMQPAGVPSGNGARYGFHYNGDPGKAAWEIKYDGVTTGETRVWTRSDLGPPTNGDVLRIEARGSDPVAIKGFLNGAEIMSITDDGPSRIRATGLPGMVSRAAMAATLPAGTPIFASWQGGELP